MRTPTRTKEKMIHPTKIHLAISNRTGTAQSSPHFLAIVVVHCLLAIRKIVAFDCKMRERERGARGKQEDQNEEGRNGGRTCSDEIMVTATKISNP